MIREGLVLTLEVEAQKGTDGLSYLTCCFCLLR